MKIDELIATRFKVSESFLHQIRLLEGHFGPYPEAESFQKWSISALSLLKDVFGETSPHYQTFKRGHDNFRHDISEHDALKGVFFAAKSDFENGFLEKIENAVTGELLGDFIQLAKSSLDEGYKDVAAVLASAALEDALKRYATSNDLSVSDKVMQEVVAALKSKGLVQGATKTLLDNMPKLRDYAMHANWDKLTPEDVRSMIGFVEEFLIQKF
ncbi:MAG: DUF4145 domain-containing protein [Verrucomicrobia bacterium]|nr:DUF4145 domain-containing protein [Verrucomicrobiota bacterium]